MRVSIYQIFEINRILRLSYKYKSFLSKVVNFFCKNYYTTILTIRYCAFGVFYFRFFFQCRFCLALALEALLKALVERWLEWLGNVCDFGALAFLSAHRKFI